MTSIPFNKLIEKLGSLKLQSLQLDRASLRRVGYKIFVKAKCKVCGTVREYYAYNLTSGKQTRCSACAIKGSTWRK